MPEIHSDLCSRRVLTMEYIQGVPCLLFLPNICSQNMQCLADIRIAPLTLYPATQRPSQSACCRHQGHRQGGNGAVWYQASGGGSTGVRDVQ